MIITHASAEKIEKIESSPIFSSVLKGCLFFGEEGNGYNLANDCAYQYNLEVDEDNILTVKNIWYDHEPAEVEGLLKELANDLGEDFELEKMAALIDMEEEPDYAALDGQAGWLVQQYQGLIAHNLGYDAAYDVDEQGGVYIVYCVGKENEWSEVKHEA